jgi:phosphate starvation-inducible PhoH-like protein
MTKRLLNEVKYIIQKQNRLQEQDLNYAIDFIKSGKEGSLKELLDDIVCITASGKSIKPKTFGQKRYVDSLRRHDVVFGIGPAGTGKTYLAMAMAVQAFKNREVNRIILTRPAVEAGENLGFLPGDLQEKVDPYLRPIYDALFEILGVDTYLKYFEKGLIEVAPLAYMRGRTLDSAYVILDEAQNTTNEQMKMFLTRLGFGSKAIITGDITQIDLIRGKESGLKTVMGILKDVKGIDFINLTSADIVRHPLVQRIINAYESYEERK